MHREDVVISTNKLTVIPYLIRNLEKSSSVKFIASLENHAESKNNGFQPALE